MEKVFEINRNFRNEGLSPRHNPEFTMMELYQAYADYGVMMEITEELVTHLVATHCSGGQLPFGEKTLDYSRPWRRATYAELLKECAGCDIDDIAAVRQKARQLGVQDIDKKDDAVVVSEVFEATVEEKLMNPTFVLDYPAAICPLTRQSKKDPRFAERFELYIAGWKWPTPIRNSTTRMCRRAISAINFADCLPRNRWPRWMRIS